MDLVVYLSASVFLLKLDKSSCEDWCTRLMVQGTARGTWLPRGAPGYQGAHLVTMWNSKFRNNLVSSRKKISLKNKECDNLTWGWHLIVVRTAPPFPTNLAPTVQVFARGARVSFHRLSINFATLGGANECNRIFHRWHIICFSQHIGHGKRRKITVC